MARDLGASVTLCVADLPVEELRKRISERNALKRLGEFHISDQDLDRALSFWDHPTPLGLAEYDPMPD
jgi:hypothetical protein